MASHKLVLFKKKQQNNSKQFDVQEEICNQ